MKRAAFVFTLGALALLAACTQDFDAMFGDEDVLKKEKNEKDDDDDTTEIGTSNGGGGGTSGDPVKTDPLACGAPVAKCEQSERNDEEGFGVLKSCSGCGCTCELISCPPDGTECTVSCTGGSTCKSVCTDHADCSFVTEGSTSSSSCDASSCELECVNGSTCTLDCSTSGSCFVNVDASSTATVSCGAAKTCKVTCGEKPATICKDGSRACGPCPG